MQALNYIAQAFGADPLFNYVNDYLIAQLPGTGLSSRDLGAMDMACNLMGFRGKLEKRKGPVTCLSALGIEVDSVAWELRIDLKRLQVIMKDLLEWRQHVRAPVRDIALFHGQLSFVACVIKPGHIFCSASWKSEDRPWSRRFNCQQNFSQS